MINNLASPPAPVTPPKPASGWAGLTSISVGSGLVLVFFPSAALYFGHARLGRDPLIGLPTVAIFGILILLGALALVSTMFARLEIGNRDEPLGLPAGSIRSVIALALIVLFALMSVMLFHTLSRSTETLEGLSLAAKNELTADRTNHVLAIKPVQCPAEAASTSAPTTPAAAASAQPAAAAAASSAPSTAASAPATVACGKGEAFSYTVTLGNTQGAPAVDFAKQLLTLIGGLMTSVVSFYFAARSADQSVRTVASAMAGRSGAPGGTSPGSDRPHRDSEADHEHGDVKNATDDKDLPPAKGGVTI